MSFKALENHQRTLDSAIRRIAWESGEVLIWKASPTKFEIQILAGSACYSLGSKNTLDDAIKFASKVLRYPAALRQQVAITLKDGSRTCAEIFAVLPSGPVKVQLATTRRLSRFLNLMVCDGFLNGTKKNCSPMRYFLLGAGVKLLPN